MDLANRLKQAVNEKDVENAYRSELEKGFEDAKITSPYGTDGLLEHKTVRALLEFKDDKELKEKIEQANVLIQALYYIKKFEDNGKKLPNVIFVGDKNECFAIHTNAIVKYLSKNIDWTIAPSQAHKHNPDLIMAMVDDTDILPFVYDIYETPFSKVIEQIKDLAENVVRKIRITKNNIMPIYEYFDQNVIGKTSKLSTNEKANLFIQIVINPSENYMHPQKKNILVTKNFGDLKINSNKFYSFFRHFNGDDYTSSEKEELTALVDRLIEDETRKRKGEFFTPTIWVNEATKMIAEEFGEDWREKYVVWDCAWGTGNLTRDYRFKKLFCSTIEQSDIDTANQMGYNPEAIKFVFDFLNDSDEKLKEIVPELYDMIYNWGNYKDEYKGIIFFINPPYGTANEAGSKGKEKHGIALTEMNLKMKEDGWGASSQQLYAQFLYRITQYQKLNKNVNIGLFSPPLFLSGGSYKKFRRKFFEYFNFKTGYLINANNFADVKDWGLVFSVLKNSNVQLIIYHNYKNIKIDNNVQINDSTNDFTLFLCDNLFSNMKKCEPFQLLLKGEICKYHNLNNNEYGYLKLKNDEINSYNSSKEIYGSYLVLQKCSKDEYKKQSIILNNNKSQRQINQFIYIQKEINKNIDIVNYKKTIYNIDNILSFSDWIKRNIKQEKTFDAPQMSSAINIKDRNGRGKIAKNSIGYYVNVGNNVFKNTSGIYLLSTTSNEANGISVLQKNYLDVVCNFTARKSIKSTWINQKDEYIAPTEQIQQTTAYKQFNNDAIVYSLFNTSSNQSSLRQIEYKDKLWDIKNEFFWMSVNELKELGDKYQFDELYQDARTDTDRFVYRLLNGLLTPQEKDEVGLTHIDDKGRPILSSDAQELLNLSKSLIVKSFKYRKFLHEVHPEYHLQTWDAGWYQIKKILNEYYSEEYKEFVVKYKEFENRLRPQVYEFGMLLR